MSGGAGKRWPKPAAPAGDERQRDLFTPSPAEASPPPGPEPVDAEGPLPVCNPEIVAVERLLVRIKRHLARSGYLATQERFEDADRHRAKAAVLWSELENTAARARRHV